jgi:hypothetical protein
MWIPLRIIVTPGAALNPNLKTILFVNSCRQIYLDTCVQAMITCADLQMSGSMPS